MLKNMILALGAAALVATPTVANANPYYNSWTGLPHRSYGYTGGYYGSPYAYGAPYGYGSHYGYGYRYRGYNRGIGGVLIGGALGAVIGGAIASGGRHHHHRRHY